MVTGRVGIAGIPGAFGEPACRWISAPRGTGQESLEDIQNDVAICRGDANPHPASRRDGAAQECEESGEGRVCRGETKQPRRLQKEHFHMRSFLR